MSDVRLIVNGKRYIGWKTIQVAMAMDSIAGSFELGFSDRWAGQNQPWPIAEEDLCQVQIDGQTVIDGYVDSRTVSLTGNDRSLSVSGRDRAAALVDCSAVLERWAFRKGDALTVAKIVCEPLGIKVSVQPGLVLPKFRTKIAVSPGDSVFNVIEKVAQASGVLAVSDGAGGVLLTRAGTARTASALVQGKNILAVSVDYDSAERFGRYVVVTQIQGTDEASGEATRIRAEAKDAGVRRAERVLLIQPEAGITADFARRRADWEARVRAARAETVSVTVRGWQQPGGGLWPVNALAQVEAPAVGVNGELLISRVSFVLSDAGETTSITLVRPDAFTPEPKAVVSKSGTRWKELAGGAR